MNDVTVPPLSTLLRLLLTTQLANPRQITSDSATKVTPHSAKNTGFSFNAWETA